MSRPFSASWPTMGSEAQILLGLLFGAVGLGYFVYGKNQKAVMPFLSGIGLMVVPYFLSSTWLLVAAGGVLLCLPWIVRW